ncbi:MAG: flagellar hook-associated protein FlgL [Methylococcaceae bacterium]|nr:flagellar hook-associated protein FlgL [Methylococcaceae bacterium]
MRISTSWAQQLSVNAMLNQQAKVSSTQMQLSTGLKNLTPADDPIAAKKILDFQQHIDKTTQYQENVDVAKSRNGLEGSVLINGRDSLLRARDLAVQALNEGVLKQEDKTAIAEEIKQIQSHMLALANTQDANGEYIFSGALSKTPTFLQAPTYAFQASQTQRELQIGPERRIADGDLGYTVFENIPTASAAPPAIRSIFATLGAFVDALEGTVTPYHGVINEALADIDSTLGKVGEAEARVGARLRALDDQTNQNESYRISMQAALSEVKDLDYAGAISQFELDSAVLQASQQAFSKVKSLSLFNYL